MLPIILVRDRVGEILRLPEPIIDHLRDDPIVDQVPKVLVGAKFSLDP
jgi:hypothetical protein